MKKWFGWLIAVVVLCCAHSHKAKTISIDIAIPEVVSQPAFSDEEIECIARTVYWEARSQSIEGQRAVAAVIINRALSPRWPSNACAVVRQSRQFAYSLRHRPNADARQKARQAALDTTHRWYLVPEDAQQAVYFCSATCTFGPLVATIDEHNFYTM